MIYLPNVLIYCPKCKTSKLPSEYSRNKRLGHAPYCKTCKRLIDKDYRERNPQKVSAGKKRCYQRKKDYYQEKNRQYHQSHRDQILQQHAAYREANREHLRSYQRQYNRAYYRANKKKYGVWARGRRAKQHSIGGVHTIDDVKRQYERQKGICYWCGKALNPDNFHVDHVMPIAKGGSNGPDNLVVAHPHCNLSKGDKLPHEWKGGNGKLL